MTLTLKTESRGPGPSEPPAACVRCRAGSPEDPAQARRAVVGMGYSMALCLGFMVLDTTARSLGVRGILPWPVVAAWLPVIVAGSLVVVFYDTVDS